MEALIRIAPGAPLRTSAYAGLAADVLALLPGLARHRCACGSPRGIVAEMADTELPHLLEHVVLELMVLSGSPRSLEGDTRWDFSVDGHGVFRVSIEYDDDRGALAALGEGAALVEAVCAGNASSYDLISAVDGICVARAR